MLIALSAQSQCSVNLDSSKRIDVCDIRASVYLMENDMRM